MKLEIGVLWTKQPKPDDPDDETEYQLFMLDEYLDQEVYQVTENWVATEDSKEIVRFYRKH